MASTFTGNKVVAIAKNYAKHALEMGGTGVKRERPSFFVKPRSTVISPGTPIIKPALCKNLHHEVELGVVISRKCTGAKAGEWASYVKGYCLGLDMTARDLQDQCKKEGMPWTFGKCWDTFTPLSHVIPASAFPEPHSVELWLKVDGVEKQRGTTGDMLAKIPELIAEVSAVMTLEEGDVILTGTPEGVGPVQVGETITCGITGHVEMSFKVVAPQ
jgi:acylpyruvate hydrolase